MRHALYRTMLEAVVLAGLALAGGCGSSAPAPAAPSVSITRVGWYEESIDPSFWTTPPPNGQTAFFDFIIHYTGEIAFSDIEYARVYLPGGTRWWTLNKETRYFDATARTIGGFGRWFDNAQPNILPLGDLLVEVKLTNGAISRYTRYVPAPASLTADPYSTMYSEDLNPPPAASTPMIKRASLGAINTSTAATQTLSLTFSVNDPRVYNGLVWLYDAAGTYLGGYYYFRDSATDLIRPALGGALATDGTLNTLTLHATDLTFNTGATFSQVARFEVVLTDGAQHGLLAGGGHAYDCRAISARAALTLQ
jgi:hypothetical protein